MITDFDDFCLWMYAIVDDIWKQVAPMFKRPGSAPVCSDSEEPRPQVGASSKEKACGGCRPQTPAGHSSPATGWGILAFSRELITMALVGECRGWDQETEMLSYWLEHRDLFPHVPSQSRFNRRRRNLMPAFNLIRHIVLEWLDLAQDRQCVIDSLPVPVVQFYLVPTSTGDWRAHGATFGKVSSKKQTVFGYKLHLLITLGGIILDFELAPANVFDLEVGVELLADHTDLSVIGDKAYISAEKAAELWRSNRIRLQTLPRRNQKRQLPPAMKRTINAARQIIETVNGQLSEQFHIEVNHAHTFWGLCTRLYTKLAAHTLCIYINRLLGNPDFLQIKALAFPI